MQYAELNSLSNFSFLKGASHPEELVESAAKNNYQAIALTDECSFAGIVRAHQEAKKHNFKLIVGTEITLAEGVIVVLLAENLSAYKDISRLITLGRSRQEKGSYHLSLDDLAGLEYGLIIWKPTKRKINKKLLAWFKECFRERLWLGAGNFYEGSDRSFFHALTSLAKSFAVPMTAVGDVRMHEYSRRFLLDTITAIRYKTTIGELNSRNFSNAERYLRPLKRLQHLYPRNILSETIKISERCEFTLEQIHCEYPKKIIPQNYKATTYLRHLTEKGIRKRWPSGEPLRVKELVNHELRLIEELNYEGFFLTVEDIVSFARSRGIFCQGRGSAANSAVCYCLGITEVDPSTMEMLFERFISKERNEPPDIDVDFEHERREEVIQYIYSRYGRKYAALVATVVTYRRKSAIRDVGKVLGLQSHQLKSLLTNGEWWEGENSEDRISKIGRFLSNRGKAEIFLRRVEEIIGFPRHLSQHVGGFVISDRWISEIVPIENAAMPERTVIQWDKNDLEVLGILKFDCLALGMLTAIRKSFDLIERFDGRRYKISDIPSDDKKTYQMIQKADTVGVFQIESRAQMAMLPRLKPTCFYDLVIEIAIIRPGPIQGDMVHPYLRRRRGEESVLFPSEEVRHVLERTLGVPLFQEQVIKLAVVAAGFSPGEAEVLRRSITSWSRDNKIGKFQKRLVDGMIVRGYKKDFAEAIFDQIRGFGEYGFPESHAASFALLAYVSSWLKCHEPAAFTSALLNSQPMGFYSPAQLIKDSITHGVEVRPFDVAKSEWDCTIEKNDLGQAVIRLGFRLVKGLRRDNILQLVKERREQPFYTMAELKKRTLIGQEQMVILAYAGALKSLSGNRYQAVWSSILPNNHIFLDEAMPNQEALPVLRRPAESDDMVIDYATSGFTLGSHPVHFIRVKENFRSHVLANSLKKMKQGSVVNVVGLVISRQRPQTATGVVFVTIEDETGFINLIIWPNLIRSFKQVMLSARILGVKGKVQKEGIVVHIIVEALFDHSNLLPNLDIPSRDFR